MDVGSVSPSSTSGYELSRSEVDVSPVSPSSTSGYEGERQKPGITSQCEVILLYLPPNRSQSNDFHTVY